MYKPISLDQNSVYFHAHHEHLTIGGRSLWFNGEREWSSVTKRTKVLAQQGKINYGSLNLIFEIVDSVTLPRLISFIKCYSSQCRGDVIWNYEDEDLKELGEDLQSVVGIPFNFRKVLPC